MNASAEVPPRYGCLAMFVSVAFAALLITLGASWNDASLPLYGLVFIVTTIIASTIGLPLREVALHFGRANAWAAMAIGAVTGAAMPATLAPSDGSGRAWIGVALYGLTGAVCGLIFFLVEAAPQSPRRNVVALLALAAISLAAMVMLRALII